MNWTIEQGELVYEYTGTLTNIVEYGASLDAMLGGKTAPPLSGMRVDIAFEGDVHGKLAGHLEGVDYLNIRPDGRMDLDIKGVLTTATGERIAMSAGGVVLPQEDGTNLLRENVKLTTAHPNYAWVNPLEFWAVGVADVANRKIHLRGYLPR